MWPADSPTELAQPRVADPEVMTHLVNDRPPNLLDDLGIAAAHRADGTPVDRDPVRQGAGVERRPTRQWHPLVEPQEAGRATVVLHSDGHVAHEFAQLCGYTVERLAHHHLETLGINFDDANAPENSGRRSPAAGCGECRETGRHLALSGRVLAPVGFRSLTRWITLDSSLHAELKAFTPHRAAPLGYAYLTRIHCPGR